MSSFTYFLFQVLIQVLFQVSFRSHATPGRHGDLVLLFQENEHQSKLDRDCFTDKIAWAVNLINRQSAHQAVSGVDKGTVTPEKEKGLINTDYHLSVT